MLDLISLGELLIDFTPHGKSEQGNDLFECNPGGGAANMAVAMAAYGARCAFMGKVGDDFFGNRLKQYLSDKGVDTGALVRSGEYMTTLAFVHLFADGERDFTFYRKNGADAMLKLADIDFAKIDQARALHFSSLTLVNGDAKQATFAAAAYARKRGKWVSYDVNWRANLWEDADLCRANMKEGLVYADIIKLSEEELVYLCDTADYAKGARMLFDLGAKLVLVSKGSAGSEYYSRDFSGQIAPFTVTAVDGTGAGDCFFGNAVAGMLEANIDLDHMAEETLRDILTFASAAAALCVTGKGAMPSMPDKARTASFLKSRSK